MLSQRSLFVGGRHPEEDLSTQAWQSGLCERWGGNLVVFTLPPELSGDPLQGGLAQMEGKVLAQTKLARLAKLLRSVLLQHMRLVT